MKKYGIYRKLLRIAVLPVLLFGIVITLFCYSRFKASMYNEARESMRNVASEIVLTYDLLYEGNYLLAEGADGMYDLYKGTKNITDKNEILDKVASDTNMEISLLYMDMRINTTIKSSSGVRISGLCTNAETTARVIGEGLEAFYPDIPISTKEYLVLYVPLKNSDGSVIGMVEVAKETKALKNDVWKAVFPVLILAIPGMMLAAFLASHFTKRITDILRAIQQFLNKVAAGNLNAELDTKYLQRTDELGDISRSSVQMQKGIRSSVETDTLTSLPNRRYLFSAFSKISKKSETTGLPFSLAICDIDFFKKVNDTYGHNAGDDVLKAVAAQLKSGMAGNGFATRWGGEEFILVFDKKRAEEAAKVLEGILDNIRAMVVPTESGDVSVTMTFGVVENFSYDIDILIQTADEKLYYGKQHGRNQVVLEMKEE